MMVGAPRLIDRVHPPHVVHVVGAVNPPQRRGGRRGGGGGRCGGEGHVLAVAHAAVLI